MRGVPWSDIERMTVSQVIVELGDTTVDPDAVSRHKIESQVKGLLALAKSLNLKPHEISVRGADYVAQRMSERVGSTVRPEQVAPILTEPEFQP
jgi:hypothetical protein